MHHFTWYESCFFPENAWFSRKTYQAFPFSQKFREFGNWGKWNGKCPRKLSENLKIIEFSKYVNEPVNQKFLKIPRARSNGTEIPCMQCSLGSLGIPMSFFSSLESAFANVIF